MPYAMTVQWWGVRECLHVFENGQQTFSTCLSGTLNIFIITEHFKLPSLPFEGGGAVKIIMIMEHFKLPLVIVDYSLSFIFLDYLGLNTYSAQNEKYISLLIYDLQSED